jgi:hypothetical protein
MSTRYPALSFAVLAGLIVLSGKASAGIVPLRDLASLRGVSGVSVSAAGLGISVRHCETLESAKARISAMRATLQQQLQSQSQYADQRAQLSTRLRRLDKVELALVTDPSVQSGTVCNDESRVISWTRVAQGLVVLVVLIAIAGLSRLFDRPTAPPSGTP